MQNPNQFTDKLNLISSLKNGEPKGYTHLVKTYHHKLCVYSYGLTNDQATAEDIVQNVFLNIWNKRESLKDDFSIKNYLYKSVYNEFIDQYRKNTSVLTLEKKYIEALNNVVEEDNECTQDKLIELVKKEIENLPPKCKQTFLLSKEEGLTNIEITEYLDISIKSVEAHISKAFKILRKNTGNKLENILFLLFKTQKTTKISFLKQTSSSIQH